MQPSCHGRLSAITESAPQTDRDRDAARGDARRRLHRHHADRAATFIAQAGAGDGTLLIFLRHTSASLTIQENADPDVQTDLMSALDRLAPEDAPWIHDVEGPDDMPAHVKAMLTGVSLARAGQPAASSRSAPGRASIWSSTAARPHSREIVLQFIGSRNRIAAETQAYLPPYRGLLMQIGRGGA